MWLRVLLIGSLALTGCESYGTLDPTATSYAPAEFRNASTPDGFASPGTLVTGPGANVGQEASEELRYAAVRSPEPAGQTAATVQRQVIYAAAIRLVVVSTADALDAVNGIARSAGGHLQESDSRSITIRVPADQFETAVARIERLGEVVDRLVKASDVTEQYQDLAIRLDNARKTRERLLSHLEKTDKMEDTIRLEAEIARVSMEIEQIEGKLRFLQSQVAMSTIRVELNATQPQGAGGPRAATPFDFIGRLGDGLLAGSVETMPRKPRFLGKGPSFTPPAEFVRYFSSADLVEAMNAEGLRIKVQRQSNYDDGAIEFWHKLARRALVESRALAITAEGPLDDDAGRTRIVGTREVAGETYAYLLVLSRTKDHVYSYEAWGPKALFDAQLPALVASAKSLRR